ncbi:carboxylate--amine ligase [Ornithinimicrobium panacihumi]|uniref:carboxylate--amine ligase n=1 Tax=Ornithinimicrobium panacihumi TaxID=2008449 RepID=UPI003F89486B
MPSSSPCSSTVPFVPVVLGGDLPTYTLARAFHAELGVRTTVLTRGVPYAVRDSRIIDNLIFAGMDDLPALADHLHGIADARPGHRFLLMGTMDAWIERIGTMRHLLDERFVVPYPQLDLIERLNDKQNFAALCAELGVAHPVTRVLEHELTDTQVGEALEGMKWPLVLKAADPPAFYELDYVGKRKIGFADDLSDLLAQRRVMSDAGYAGALVIQERIPGGDEQMRVVTTYSDRSGTVRWGRVGHVLLEDHDPAWVGNPLAIIHAEQGDAVSEAARLLEHVGWTGHANFDIKVDPRDGTHYFFELNPRLGRSHGYLHAAGHPFLTPLVREHIEDRDPLDGVEMGLQRDGWLYSVVPVPLLMRYVTDPATRDRVKEIRRNGFVMRPYVYGADRHWSRTAAQVRNDAALTRNFARNYRRPVTS